MRGSGDRRCRRAEFSSGCTREDFGNNYPADGGEGLEYAWTGPWGVNRSNDLGLNYRGRIIWGGESDDLARCPQASMTSVSAVSDDSANYSLQPRTTESGAIVRQWMCLKSDHAIAKACCICLRYDNK